MKKGGGGGLLVEGSQRVRFSEIIFQKGELLPIRLFALVMTFTSEGTKQNNDNTK